MAALTGFVLRRRLFVVLFWCVLAVAGAATVKTHVNRAMAKLGARDRAQLVVLGYECGLVER